MGTLDDWMNFVNTCIRDDRIDLIAHRLYHMETEKEKLRDALKTCRTTIDESLSSQTISEGE